VPRNDSLCDTVHNVGYDAPRLCGGFKYGLSHGEAYTRPLFGLYPKMADFFSLPCDRAKAREKVELDVPRETCRSSVLPALACNTGRGCSKVSIVRPYTLTIRSPTLRPARSAADLSLNSEQPGKDGKGEHQVRQRPGRDDRHSGEWQLRSVSAGGTGIILPAEADVTAKRQHREHPLGASPIGASQ
jgi:hypothetical protein